MVGELDPKPQKIDQEIHPIIEVKDLTISYGKKPALKQVNLKVQEHEIFGIIGPANSGKTSFLKALNRMDLFVPGMTVKGKIKFKGTDVLRWKNVYALRSRIGVVFPLPVGLPMSIYDNVALAPRLAGIRKRSKQDEIVERCLRRSALWEEVKDRLDSLGSLLSGGQQQRLTIARALSQNPDLLLLDEFSIAVDPVTTMKIEDILRDLCSEMTIVLVTNLVSKTFGSPNGLFSRWTLRRNRGYGGFLYRNRSRSAYPRFCRGKVWLISQKKSLSKQKKWISGMAISRRFTTLI